MIVCAPPRGKVATTARWSVSTPPWEGVQEALSPGVRGLRPEPDKGDSGQASRPDARRERFSVVADVFAHGKVADRRLSFDNVVWAGADAMNRHNGHNYLKVFADLVANGVGLATPGRV